MIILYSDDKSIKGKDGVVDATPRFFNEIDSRAVKVITDDVKITDAYKKAGIPTEKLTKPKKTVKKSTPKDKE